MTLLVNVIKFYLNYHCHVDYLDFYLEIYMFLFQELGSQMKLLKFGMHAKFRCLFGCFYVFILLHEFV